MLLCGRINWIVVNVFYCVIEFERNGSYNKWQELGAVIITFLIHGNYENRKKLLEIALCNVKYEKISKHTHTIMMQNFWIFGV